MEQVFSFLLTVVVALLIGFGFGWGYGTTTVSIECQRLGSFYVATTVYECKERK
jgi:hypothetical protein